MATELPPPKCPKCGRPMFDDFDGLTGGWLCAYDHNAVVLYSYPAD